MHTEVLSKKIMVVYRCPISGGTDRLLIHLIKSWPDKNTLWVLYLHHENSGNNLLKKELAESNGKINHYFIGTYKYDKSRVRIIDKIKRKITKIISNYVNFFRLIAYFKSHLRKELPDVLYLHNGGYLGALDVHAAAISTLLIKKQVKVIMSIQNLPKLTGCGIKASFFNTINNKCVDYYIFGNKRTEHIYEVETNLDQKKFHSINEGVESNPNNFQNKRISKVIKIGMIGSYEERKGHSVLFKAIDILSHDPDLNKKFKVICFGQPQYGRFKIIKKMAHDMGIDNLVEFNDFEMDMDKLYMPLDIIVLPSIGFETMPLVLLDAQAYYKPTIGSEFQGIIDTIDHDENGYLFPIGDYSILSKYLKVLILDDKKRIQFGFSGRRKYERHFSARIMSNKYAKVFDLSS